MKVFRGRRRKFHGLSNADDIAKTYYKYHHILLTHHTEYSYWEDGPSIHIPLGSLGEVMTHSISSFLRSGKGSYAEMTRDFGILKESTSTQDTLAWNHAGTYPVWLTKYIYWEGGDTIRTRINEPMSYEAAVQRGLYDTGGLDLFNPCDIYSFSLSSPTSIKLTLSYSPWSGKIGKAVIPNHSIDGLNLEYPLPDLRFAESYVVTDLTPLSALANWGTLAPGLMDLAEFDLQWTLLDRGERNPAFDWPHQRSLKRESYSYVNIQTVTPVLQPGGYAFGLSIDNNAYDDIANNRVSPLEYSLQIDISDKSRLVFKDDVKGRSLFKQEHRDIITGVLSRIGDKEATVSDISRTYKQQAEAMFDFYIAMHQSYYSNKSNKQYYGVEAGYRACLDQYGKGGDMVTNYIKRKYLYSKKEGWIAHAKLMSARSTITSDAGRYIGTIYAKNRVRVSNHIEYPDKTVYAVDIAPSTVSNQDAFKAEIMSLKGQGVVSEFWFPGDGNSLEKAFHIEFPL